MREHLTCRRSLVTGSRSAWAVLALAAWACTVATAPAVEPSVSYVFPAGGQRGQQVAIRVGGHFLHGEAKFTMAGPGIEASPTVKEGETVWFEGPVIPQPPSQRAEDYPRDHHGQVTIAADAPLGYRAWRVETSQGITPRMAFEVGELPEVIEQEMDGDPLPVNVALPVTINGRIFPREDVDLWQFSAKKGETYYAEVSAARLGSPLESRLQVLDPDGQPIVENAGFFGADAFVHFTAPRDGEYQVRIHDSNFGGLQHYVYRLTINQAPYITHFYPLGGQRGGKLTLRIGGPGLIAAPAEVTLPAQGNNALVQPAWQGRTLNPVKLELSDLPEVLEAEPNANHAEANQFPLPGVANGQINKPGDVDTWAIEVAAGESYQVELRSAQLGTPLDAVLTVTDAQGKQLAAADDTGNSADPTVNFKAPAEGRCFVQVTDRFSGRGGPQFAYRLYVRTAQAQPSFEVKLPTDTVSLTPGGEAKLKVDIVRAGGFTGTVEIVAEGLPEGITLSGNSVPGNRPNTQLVLKCAEETQAPRSLRLRITAQGEQVTGPKQSEVRTPVTGMVTYAAPAGMPAESELTLFVGLATPFKFTGVFSLTYAPQGSVMQKTYTIDRGGYAGPLTVRLADKQMRHLQGVKGPTIVVPAGANEFEYPVTLPSYLEIGRTSRTILMATGEVTDSQGHKHVVSYTSANQNEQLVAIADPASLTLRAEPASVVADPGQSATVRVQIDKAAKVKGRLILEAIVPEHIHGVSAQRVVFDDAQVSAGTITLTFEPGAGPFNAPIIIRATVKNGEQHFLAETRLEVAPMPPPGTKR